VYFLESVYLAVCIARGTAPGTEELTVPPSGVINIRGAMVCGPDVDPSILIHRDPHAWEELLGWRCIEAFLEEARFVGVDSLDSLVDYSVSSPSAMRLVLAGVEFAGRRGWEWEGYLRGRLEMGARMRFPKVETGVRRDDVWIQISPAYMLLPFDETKRTWQKTAHTLTTKPRLTCRPEAEHPRRRAV